jgi:hypothetical protein
MTTLRACPGFDWLTSRNALCDRCRLRPWEHDRTIGRDGLDGPLVARPWSPLIIEEWAARGTIDPDRARHLRSMQPREISPATLRAFR